MVEQKPFKLLVLGSNPSRPTIPAPGHSRTNLPNRRLKLSLRPQLWAAPTNFGARAPPPVATTTQVKRIVIVEDQTAIREMLAEILRTDPAYKIVGESGDGQLAVPLLLELKPDVLVLDARLPGLSGVDILRRIGKQLKNTRVLVFSAYESPALVREMLEAGAHGFVEKTAGLGEFKKVSLAWT